MSKNCKKCGNELEMVVKPLTCDLTGMKYDSKFGNCSCKEENKYAHLPEHLQKKIQDLEYLEEASIALGLHDKISSARFVLHQEISEFEKAQK